MNRENHRIPGSDRAAASSARLRTTLFEAQLWLLALFVAMSLLAAAARSVIDGSESPAVSAVLAIAGIALFRIGWRNVAPLLERAEGVRRAECAEAAVATGKLQLALQR